jgi:hypothetical protein
MSEDDASSPVDAELPAREIAELHNQNEGATYNLREGSQSGKALYAVSAWNERTLLLAGARLIAAQVQAFIERNLDLLTDPRASVGTWYNRDEDVTFLDVVTTTPSRQVAISWGRAFNEIAVLGWSRAS